MLALLALGKLNQTQAFAANDVSEELVQSGVQLNEMNYCFYPELIPPLLRIGRYDLVRAIRSKMVSYRRRKKKIGLRNIVAKPIKQFDKRYFDRKIREFKKLLLASLVG